MRIIRIIKEYKKRIKKYPLLKEKYNALMKSDKVVIVNPLVEIKGLSKLKKPLYLDGNKCIIKNTSINSTSCDVLLTVFGEDNIIQDSIFTGGKK